MIKLTTKDETNFWNKVNINFSSRRKIDIIKNYKYQHSDCWIWTACKDKDGYGKFKSYHAHRFSWYFSRLRNIDGLIIRHTCDNPSCVNPFHLRSGTVQDNSDDMVRRERSLFCDRHKQTKLKNDQVIQIYELLKSGEYCYDISKKFGAEEYIIWEIGRGKSFKKLYNSLNENTKQIIKEQNKIKSLRNKIDENDVRKIRELFQNGWLKSHIAKKYGLQPTTITNILTGKSWAHVK